MDDLKKRYTEEFRIVFTDENEFVEVEDQRGFSVRAGEWFTRNDGYHELRIPLTPPPGYALVKLEGAEERVARAIAVGSNDYHFEKTGKLSTGFMRAAQAAIKALTEGEDDNV